MVQQVQLDIRDLQDSLDHPDHKVWWDILVQWVCLAPLVLQVLRVQLVSRELLDYWDRLEIWAELVLPDQLVIQGQMEILETLGQLDLKDPRA